MVVTIELALAVAFGGALFAVGEWIGMLRFSAWAFRIGPRVLVETREFPPSLSGATAADTGLGQFKELSTDTWMFRPRSRGLSLLDAFAVKGTIHWDAGQVTIVGRVPLFSVVFLGSWLVGWTILAVLMGVSGSSLPSTLGVGVVGPVAVPLLVYVLIPFEVRRARKVLGEFEELLRENRGSR